MLLSYEKGLLSRMADAAEAAGLSDHKGPIPKAAIEEVLQHVFHDWSKRLSSAEFVAGEPYGARPKLANSGEPRLDAISIIGIDDALPMAEQAEKILPILGNLRNCAVWGAFNSFMGAVRHMSNTFTITSVANRKPQYVLVVPTEAEEVFDPVTDFLDAANPDITVVLRLLPCSLDSAESLYESSRSATLEWLDSEDVKYPAWRTYPGFVDSPAGSSGVGSIFVNCIQVPVTEEGFDEVLQSVFDEDRPRFSVAVDIIDTTGVHLSFAAGTNQERTKSFWEHAQAEIVATAESEFNNIQAMVSDVETFGPCREEVNRVFKECRVPTSLLDELVITLDSKCALLTASAFDYSVMSELQRSSVHFEKPIEAGDDRATQKDYAQAMFAKVFSSAMSGVLARKTSSSFSQTPLKDYRMSVITGSYRGIKATRALSTVAVD